MSYIATKKAVGNRGEPPDSFLDILVRWGRSAPAAVFLPNTNRDIYSVIKPQLGPWQTLPERRAAMLEAMRVHAGLESSWNWKEGVDTSNHTSMTHITGQETGVFQVSFDSTAFDNLLEFAKANHAGTPQLFIPAMKLDCNFALEYYARLVRERVDWAGPLISGAINKYLSREAMAEFQALLA